MWPGCAGACSTAFFSGFTGTSPTGSHARAPLEVDPGGFRRGWPRRAEDPPVDRTAHAAPEWPRAWHGWARGLGHRGDRPRLDTDLLYDFIDRRTKHST